MKLQKKINRFAMSASKWRIYIMSILGEKELQTELNEICNI